MPAITDYRKQSPALTALGGVNLPSGDMAGAANDAARDVIAKGGNIALGTDDAIWVKIVTWKSVGVA
jgi:hypothetical protein